MELLDEYLVWYRDERIKSDLGYRSPHAVPEGSGAGSVGIRSKLTTAVPVYIERPDEHDGFPHVTCWLPDDVWEGNFGFSESDLPRFKDIVRSCAHLLLEFAAGGRFENV